MNNRAKWEEFFEKEARAKGVTKDEIREAWAKFFEEQLFDKMVEDGTFRCVGINKKGRKVYVSKHFSNR